jgi:hypothetical protein
MFETELFGVLFLCILDSVERVEELRALFS